MKKILFLDNEKIYKTWASKTYEYKINSIKNDVKFIFKNIDDLYEFSDTIIFGWNAMFLSKYYTIKHDFYKKKIKNLENYEEIKKKLNPYLESKSKKYLVVQDFNCPHDYQDSLKGLVNYLSIYKFCGIITPYLETEGTQFIRKKLPSLKILHIPHHIDSNHFQNWKSSKKYDIFIFGNTHKNFYPFRNRLLNLLKDSNYRINIWPGFRNYFRFNKNISNNKLSEAINKSWLTICTSSKFDLLLGKYFETSMSGSIVCGNMPKDGIEIWKNNFIELTPDMSDDEIFNSLKGGLKYKSKLLKKIQKMLPIMEDYHLNKFSNKLFNLINDKKN